MSLADKFEKEERVIKKEIENYEGNKCDYPLPGIYINHEIDISYAEPRASAIPNNTGPAEITFRPDRSPRTRQDVKKADQGNKLTEAHFEEQILEKPIQQKVNYPTGVGHVFVKEEIKDEVCEETWTTDAECLEEKKYKCEVCEKEYVNKKYLSVHMKIHSAVKKFKCVVCQQAYTQSSSLYFHLKKHYKHDTYCCRHCNKIFKTLMDLKEHELVHNSSGDPKKKDCDICGKVFRKHSNLVEHMVVHTGVRKYPCTQCDKRFTQSSNLHTHLKRHTGIKAYKCDRDSCQKTFYNANQLKYHMFKHNGSPYECKICYKTFANSTVLKNHYIVHENDKPFHCDVCQKCFNFASNFNKHIATHDIDKPYTCSICDETFDIYSHLYIHKADHAASDKPLVT